MLVSDLTKLQVVVVTAGDVASLPGVSEGVYLVGTGSAGMQQGRKEGRKEGGQ